MKKNPLFKKYSVDTSNLLYLKTNEAQLKAVKKNGYAIRYISNPSPEVQIEAVKQDGNAIQWISNPSPEVQIEAVKKNGYAIRFISNPSPEVQLQAVKQYGNAIQWISNPSEEAQLQAVNKLLQENITNINEYYPYKLSYKVLEYLLKNLVIRDIIT